jgi:multidrug efflux pump subunit AcrB
MILLLGANSLRTLQRDRFPKVDWGWIDITTQYPGASPQDVELNVTIKIEDALEGITGIKEVRSISIENVSNVFVEIQTDAKDPEKIKDKIREAVNRITDLPEEVTQAPLIEEQTTASETILGVGLTGELPYRELRRLAKELEQEIKSVPGVARTVKLSYRDREVQIDVDPRALEFYHVSLREIIEAIKARNIRLTGGTFESYTSEKNILTLAQFEKPEDVGDVIVRSTFDGPLITVKDLAVITDDFEEEELQARVFGKSAILIGIYKDEDADIIRTVQNVRRKVKEESLRRGGGEAAARAGDSRESLIKRLLSPFQRQKSVDELPFGPATVYFSDDISKYVANSFRIVLNNGLIGLTLVIMMLTLFLNFRSAFWVALGIPVSLMGVFFLLPVFDSFLDTVTLTVLVIVMGIVVDDGIIISENISNRIQRGETPLEAAVNGTDQVFFPVLTTVLTTFIAFVPLFWMEGTVGKVVYVVPMTIGLAVLISLIEAVVALPAHLCAGYKKSTKAAQRAGIRKWFDRLRGHYGHFCRGFLKFRYLLIPLFIAVLAGSLYIAAQSLDFVLFPSKGAEWFHLWLELPTGSSLEATAEQVKKVEALIQQLPEEELESYYTRIGRTSWGATQNSASIGVSLTPYSERNRSADEIVEKLREKIDEFEGVERAFFNVDTGGPPVGKAIALRIIGHDDSARRRLTEAVKAYLETLEGVKDIDSNDDLGKEQIEIKIDYKKLARLGLTAADLAQNVRIAFDGEVVTSIRQEDEEVDFRVRFIAEARQNLDFLKRMTIPNREGRLIRLDAVADLETGPGLNAYRHLGGKRVTTTTADVDQEVTTSLKATQAVLDHFDLERDWPGLKWDVGGEAEESRKSIINLVTSFVLAILGIYFLLVILFESFTQPLIVLIAVPFGVIGVIFALVSHGQQAGFLALMGSVGLAGIVVNDSLVLVSHLNELKRQNEERDMLDMIAEGTSNRLRAILLTTLTTAVGLLPLAYGIGGLDLYMSPMALTMGYGLLFATPLTLILVPCLYAVGNDLSRLLFRKR